MKKFIQLGFFTLALAFVGTSALKAQDKTAGSKDLAPTEAKQDAKTMPSGAKKACCADKSANGACKKEEAKACCKKDGAKAESCKKDEAKSCHKPEEGKKCEPGCQKACCAAKKEDHQNHDGHNH